MKEYQGSLNRRVKGRGSQKSVQFINVRVLNYIHPFPFYKSLKHPVLRSLGQISKTWPCFAMLDILLIYLFFRIMRDVISKGWHPQKNQKKKLCVEIIAHPMWSLKVALATWVFVLLLFALFFPLKNLFLENNE